MSLLTKKYREAIAKDKNAIKEARTGYTFRTKLDILDYKNGKLIQPAGNDPYFATGIEEGSYIMIIGRSGSGKSALALQMAANIVKPYPNGAIYLDDVEASNSITRFKQLTGWSNEEIKEKLVHRNVGITSESFYKNINDVYKLKMENKEELTVVTDKLDDDGNPIEILEPTVYILDSLAVLTTDAIADEDELSGQMSQTAVARANAAIFRRILPKLKKANIILIVINHVNQKVSINPMQPQKASINYLKQDEAIPGGNTPLYLANNIFRVDTGSKLTSDKEYGINGFMSKITIIKSRSNRAGQEIDLVYDQNRGFDNILSNYNLLKQEKQVGGAGRSFYLLNCPTAKFSQKDFKKKLKENVELQQAYKEIMAEVLSQFIYVPEDLDEEVEDENDNEIVEDYEEEEY